jgi:hypothetical protein
MRVVHLSDLRGETECLQAIEAGLRGEWGPYAFLGFDGIDEMAARAGETIFVVIKREGDDVVPRGIVQTMLGDFHGDPAELVAAYPSFTDLTSRDSWKRSRRKGGDTAVLLQITTLGPTERGGGLGSLLRNAVLNMLDKQVKYALTTTPIDGIATGTLNPADPSTYSAAMRFHARGGARPTIVLPGYKTPDPPTGATSHGHDVVVMRYERDPSGVWPAPRPEMRVRSMGPLQERLSRAVRRRKLGRLHAPHLHRPSLHLHLRRSRSAEGAAETDAEHQDALDHPEAVG